MIKLGVVGCGKMGMIHMEAVREAGADLVAVADVNEDAARAAAEKFQVKQVYRDAEQLLASPDVQAVILALPTGLRTPLALSALKHRKHVLLEKPAAASVAELKQMREAAGNRVVAVASSRFRTYPVAQVARDAVRAGELGAIRVIRCRAVMPAGEAPSTPPPVWRLSKRLNGGGILVNWGVYDLDFLLSIVDFNLRPQTALAQTWTVPNVYADRAAPGSDAETHLTALIRCAGGAVIFYERGEFTTTCGQPAWEITGDRGSLRLNMLPGKGQEVVLDRSTSNGVESRTLWSGDTVFDKVHHGPVRDFVEAAQGNHQPLTSLREAIVIQQIVDAIYTSAESGTCAQVPTE